MTMINFHIMSVVFTAAAAMSFATGQRIIVVSSAGNRDRGGSLSSVDLDNPPTSTTDRIHIRSLSSPSHEVLFGKYHAKPPCLEPFRKLVREECRRDASTYCGTSSTIISDPVSARTMRTSDPFLNSLMESPSLSSLSLSADDSFENIMDTMMNEFFGHWMDLDARIRMDGTVNSSPIILSVPPSDEVPYDNNNFFVQDDSKNVVADKETALVPTQFGEGEMSASRSTTSSSSSSVDMEAALDEAAENSLDNLVAALAQRFVYSDSEDYRNYNKESNLPSSSSASTEKNVKELSQRLSQWGSDLLSETRTARRRRLQEASGSSEDILAIDRQLHIKERLARRLTEYRTDLVYHPNGSVTVFTSSVQSPSSSTYNFLHDMHALVPSHYSAIPPLGMGSTKVDECLKSRYEQGDLSAPCLDAVSQLYAAASVRSPPQHGHDGTSSRRNGELLQEGSPWYYDPLKFWCFMMMIVFLPVELYLCLSRKVEDDKDNGNSQGEIQCDYEMLPSEEEQDSGSRQSLNRREKVPRVYLGVPVQVV